MKKLKEWEDLEPGLMFKTRRGADGPAVLVDPRDWSERPLDHESAALVTEVECGGTKTSVWSVHTPIEDSDETTLD